MNISSQRLWCAEFWKRKKCDNVDKIDFDKEDDDVDDVDDDDDVDDVDDDDDVDDGGRVSWSTHACN